MSSLKFRWCPARRFFSVFSPVGELLSKIDCAPETSDEEAVFQALDSALATARLKRNDEHGARILRKLALYNPYTGQVSFNATPKCKVYALKVKNEIKPISIPSEGIVAFTEENTMLIGNETLTLINPTYKDAFKALSSHEEKLKVTV